MKILIDLTRTSNHQFKSLISRIFRDKYENEKYFDPELVGILSSGTIHLQQHKINEFNPEVMINNNIIHSQLYIQVLIKDDSSGKAYDLDSVIDQHRVNEVIISSSFLESLKIGFHWNVVTHTILTINNTKFNSLHINQVVRTGKQITIETKFDRVECKYFAIYGIYPNGGLYKNIKAEVISVDAKNILLENVEFNIPIISNPAINDLQLKQSTLIYGGHLLGGIKTFNYAINGEILINEPKYGEILASLKYLAGKPDSEIFINALERTYAFFDSQDSIWKRILFSYTGFYYKFWPSFCGLFLGSLLFQLILQNSQLDRRGYGLAYAFIPNELIKDILFKDFHLEFSIVHISIAKILLALVTIFVYYSLFAFLLAIKKNFGFRKIR